MSIILNRLLFITFFYIEHCFRVILISTQGWKIRKKKICFACVRSAPAKEIGSESRTRKSLSNISKKNQSVEDVSQISLLAPIELIFFVLFTHIAHLQKVTVTGNFSTCRRIIKMMIFQIPLPDFSYAREESHVAFNLFSLDER